MVKLAIVALWSGLYGVAAGVLVMAVAPGLADAGAILSAPARAYITGDNLGLIPDDHCER